MRWTLVLPCIVLTACVQNPECANGYKIPPKSEFQKCVEMVEYHNRDGAVIQACSEFSGK